jgi:glutamine synthetase
VTPEEVIECAKKQDAITELEESSFEEGFGFDGSSIRGWAAINEMLLIPDPATAMLDPLYETKTLVMLCNVIDPITRQHYDRGPRWIARKAEMYLKNSGLADTAYFGAEAEIRRVADDVLIGHQVVRAQQDPMLLILNLVLTAKE